jgi:hypothetical protein
MNTVVTLENPLASGIDEKLASTIFHIYNSLISYTFARHSSAMSRKLLNFRAFILAL